MTRRRLEEAILAGYTMGLGDYIADDSDHDIQSRLASASKLTLPLDRWGIYSLQYCPNGENLAVGFGNGGIYIVKQNGDNFKVSELTHGHRKGLAVMSLKYLRDENGLFLLSAGAAGAVNVWDLNTDAKIEPLFTLEEEGNEINALDLSCDCTFFATAGKDRHIRLYDATTMKPFQTIEAPDYLTMDEISVYTGHTKRVFALKFHPEENHLFLTAGWDDCVKLWDKRMARNAKKSIAGPHVCGAGLDVRGNTVLTGSWSAKRSLQLWDLRAGTLERNISYPHDIKAEGEFLYCAKYVTSDVVVAGGSGTNNACAISLNADNVLGVISSAKPVLAVDTCKAGKHLAVAGSGGNLQVASFA
ncbi:unnamed protein product [Clavelina lepadiformis]|uniref:Uncharacterized protein n=1 Tax=Clavelina lepadiformis TaxID=159417 RepID=A0ABP0H2T1_CLALP